MEINEFMGRVPGFVEQAINAAKVVSDGKIDISTSLNSISKLDAVVQSFQNLWVKKGSCTNSMGLPASDDLRVQGI